MQKPQSATSGSVLIWTVLVITILSLAAAELMHVVSSKYNNALHTATWQEALLGAESGVDLAVRELRKSLNPANTPWSEAEGWTSPTPTPTPEPGASVAPATVIEHHGKTEVANAGLAGTTLIVKVEVDAPVQLKDTSNGWQYYRVRATGTMPLTGPVRANDSRQDTRLRRFSLRGDHFTGEALAAKDARVTRRVEAIVRPISAFDQAIVSAGVIDLTDQNIIIDSYDSRDPRKSTNGLYPGADARNEDGTLKRQENGNIATNGNLINAGNARVYGDVATNSGTITGVANITGTQRTDFYQTLDPVLAPKDSALGEKMWGSVNNTATVVNGTTTLAANAVEGSIDSRYIVSSITLSGNQKLTLAGKPDGSPTYIEIYVTGQIDATGLAEIILEPGVKAKIYTAGNVTIAGNGIINKNNQPGDLMIYGINPTDGSSRTMAIGGNSQLSAAVYAPAFDVQINNGGTRGSVYGSFVGKTVKMNGVTDLHYDEALGAGGRISNYKIVSWFEDWAELRPTTVAATSP